MEYIEKTNSNIIEEYAAFYQVMEEMNDLIQRHKS